MSCSVLYVDDDEANLVVFEAAFRSGFDVLTASSAKEALQLMESRDVAVLLTDQRMPVTSGAQLAAEVRALYPETFRYLVTAYSDLQEAIEAINEGQIQRYFRKPWHLDELREALSEAVELYGLRRRVGSLEHRLQEVDRIYSLGVVTAGIAHELRSPLAVARAAVQLLEDEVEGRGPEVKNLVQSALDKLDHMSDIVQGIELSSRQSKDDVECDLAEIVRLTLSMTRANLVRRARLQFRPTAVPPVLGSETRLSQVVLNLIVNAIESFPEDRQPSENRVAVNLSQMDSRVVLEVADNGPGITEGELARIFDNFYTTKAEGTGLGLPICRQIVEQLGGELRAESELGEGSRFVMSLPVYRSAPTT